jgi:CRISPR/Cas system CSM-associated protein Csm3 (group 7 of RAMP superfamily)
MKLNNKTMEKYENKISAANPLEVERSPRMCEIRFDCVVTMYEFEVLKSDKYTNLRTERSHPPQWFKNECKITLEAIKYADEYALGRQLKEMLFQLENHIKHIENQQSI